MTTELETKIRNVLEHGSRVEIRFNAYESAPWEITVGDASPTAIGTTLDEAFLGLGRILDDFWSGSALDRWAPPSDGRVHIPGKQTGFLP